MVDDFLDQNLHIVRCLAKRKANSFSRRHWFAAGEGEDVESQLVVAFLVRWQRFDINRASVQTFASMVMDAELTCILRYRLAEKRQFKDLHPWRSSLKDDALRHFQIDVQRALMGVPTAIRETAFALAQHSTIDAAVALGCSRQMINRRKHLIRNALVSAGIGADYFGDQGQRQ